MSSFILIMLTKNRSETLQIFGRMGPCFSYEDKVLSNLFLLLLEWMIYGAGAPTDLFWLLWQEPVSGETKCTRNVSSLYCCL